jgi:hypothetical protein
VRVLPAVRPLARAVNAMCVCPPAVACRIPEPEEGEEQTAFTAGTATQLPRLCLSSSYEAASAVQCVPSRARTVLLSCPHTQPAAPLPARILCVCQQCAVIAGPAWSIPLKPSELSSVLTMLMQLRMMVAGGCGAG